MNRKLIISKTVLFIVVMVFVICFKSVFGSENTLIGVTTITATLMFLERDYTLSPIKNTLKFIILNLAIGIATYIASANMYLGIIVNFIMIFYISYKFCYNLRNPMYTAFSLQYLFLLAYPVTGQRFIIRLLSLITGAIIIMLAQVLLNRNKLSKSGNKILETVCDSILNKIEYKDEFELVDDGLDKINASIDAFRSLIYDKREYNYYLTEEARLKLSLSVALENIYSLIYKINIISIDSDILNTLEALVNEVKYVINNNKDDKENHNTTEYMRKLFKICEEKNITDLLNLQLLDSMILLSDTIENLKSLDIRHYNFVDKSNDIKNIFSDKTSKSFLFDRKSLKFCYAMRLAITISIAAFIVAYFNLTEGRWILFTLLSVINPIYEVSKSKSKDRIIYTFVGCFIIFILFSIFQSDTARMLIVMACGYLNGFVKEYKYSMIFVTISAIGSAAVIGNVHELTFNRIFYVIIGTIIAILANNFLFPYTLKDSFIQLKQMYHNAIMVMFKEVKNLVEGIKEPNVMKNLVVLTSLIESKSRSNEKLLSDTTSYSKVINERRSLVTNIYELYLWILREDVNSESQKEIIKDLKDLIEYSDENIEDKIKQIESGIQLCHDINTKIILSSIIVIMKQLSHISQLNEVIEN